MLALSRLQMNHLFEKKLVTRKVVMNAMGFVITLVVLVKQKSSDERCEYGRVNDQNQYEPIPCCFERRVVQNGEAWRLCLLQGQFSMNFVVKCRVLSGAISRT